MKISDICGKTLYESNHASMLQTLEAAVEAGVSLAGADLAGADLRGARLAGADLTGARLS